MKTLNLVLNSNSNIDMIKFFNHCPTVNHSSILQYQKLQMTWIINILITLHYKLGRLGRLIIFFLMRIHYLLRRGSLASADGPHWLISKYNICPVVANSWHQGFSLSENNFLSFIGFPLFKGLTDASNDLEAILKSMSNLRIEK